MNHLIKKKENSISRKACYSCQIFGATFFGCLGLTCLYFITPSKLFKSKHRVNQWFLFSFGIIATVFSAQKFDELIFHPKPK